MRDWVSAYALAAMKTWPTATSRRVWRVRFALAMACGVAVHAAQPDPALPLPPHLVDPVAAAWADEREGLASGDATVRAAANGRLAMFHHAQQLLVEAEQLYGEAIADARLAAGGEAAEIAGAFRWHYLRGVVRRDRGLLDGAAEDFRAALEIEPEHALTHYRLGTLLVDRGDAERAATHLRRALAADGASAAALEALADAAIAAQEWSEALSLLERAWQTEPASRLAYKLAIVERRLGNDESAERWLGRRGRAAPTVHDPLLLEVAALSLNPRFYVEAATNAEARGDVGAAIEAYTQATSLAPNDASVGLALARALVRHGRPAAALEESRRILSLDGTPARALHASLAMQQGAHAEAERSYAELAGAEPEQASHLYWLAMSRLAQGACAEARAPLARALRLAPASGEAHLVAARTEALCGDADVALVRARALLKVRDDADTRMTLAFALRAAQPLEAMRIAKSHGDHEDARLILDAVTSGRAPERPFAAGSAWWQPPLP
ncbi:MAG: tetratricopeptide repeat protein [Gammaproteobacteria bacterium]|nr:tetratricopeptide repeat protein [Gammaproteobacteria bacterium]MYB38116.1 tetratricopeptide repeat protein [Gammaproteobacteria bacterium]